MSGDSARSAPFTADAKTAIVRYQVVDMKRAIAFYTERLGFRLVHEGGDVAPSSQRRGEGAAGGRRFTCGGAA